MAWRDSNRKVVELSFNLFLAALTLLAWIYVIIAGKFVSERYLLTLDLSRFAQEETEEVLWNVGEEF